MVPEELQEVAEFRRFGVIRRYGKAVVMALNVVVHGRACGGGGVAVRVPGRLDCVGSHAVIRTLLPIARGHHAFDYVNRVKLAEVAVHPRGDRSVGLAGVGINRVLVLHGFKTDARITRVRIEQCQMIHAHQRDAGILVHFLLQSIFETIFF